MSLEASQTSSELWTVQPKISQLAQWTSRIILRILGHYGALWGVFKRDISKSIQANPIVPHNAPYFPPLTLFILRGPHVQPGKRRDAKSRSQQGQVIQFVSDSGPDAAKCRRLLREDFKHIVSVPCTSYSLYLLIEDVLDLPFFQDHVCLHDQLISLIYRIITLDNRRPFNTKGVVIGGRLDLENGNTWHIVVTPI